jgi:excisionase family DNA binding protein
MAERRQASLLTVSGTVAVSCSGRLAALTQGANRKRRNHVAGSQCSLDTLPPLLTMGEVATVLRTSRKAVYAMSERVQLPGVTRIGRRLLVRRDDLLSWLDERRAASPGGTRR